MQAVSRSGSVNYVSVNVEAIGSRWLLWFSCTPNLWSTILQTVSWLSIIWWWCNHKQMLLRSGRNLYYGYWRAGQYYCDQRIQGSSYCAPQCPTFVQEEIWEPQRDRWNQEAMGAFQIRTFGTTEMVKWLRSLVVQSWEQGLDPNTRIASHASPSSASRWGEDRRIVGTSQQRKHGPHVQWETLPWWNK